MKMGSWNENEKKIQESMKTYNHTIQQLTLNCQLYSDYYISETWPPRDNLLMAELINFVFRNKQLDINNGSIYKIENIILNF